MRKTIQLSKMTIEEKIRTMENLWDDLCRCADTIPSPSWHEKVLKLREKAIEEGREKFVDWDIEKDRIQQSLK